MQSWNFLLKSDVLFKRFHQTKLKTQIQLTFRQNRISVGLGAFLAKIKNRQD